MMHPHRNASLPAHVDNALQRRLEDRVIECFGNAVGDGEVMGTHQHRIHPAHGQQIRQRRYTCRALNHDDQYGVRVEPFQIRFCVLAWEPLTVKRPAQRRAFQRPIPDRTDQLPHLLHRLNIRRNHAVRAEVQHHRRVRGGGSGMRSSGATPCAA